MDKVIWTEGLFLRPQHFQQMERYLEHYAHAGRRAAQPFCWGFETLSLDEQALSMGTRLVMMHEGTIIQNGSLAELKQLLPPAKVEYVEKQPTLEEIFLAITTHGEPTLVDTRKDGSR